MIEEVVSLISIASSILLAIYFPSYFEVLYLPAAYLLFKALRLLSTSKKVKVGRK
ncbi:MAG: hypothetical protein TQ35_0002030 [Candidatus Aramenus sulfurataquae]|jgi:hypothetical protein|uniref:Uncharacterized protein n=2 Tax=Candidatus Aramenus sulfurataquae TaxID=1326980 RepID=A0AAE3FHP0_9CREN|nr:hypothetical protein [Candidatus Aramenus sulfurataquae]